jgi:NADP-dependent 3-hydroxy acid dehydrogenase YdfG
MEEEERGGNNSFLEAIRVSSLRIAMKTDGKKLFRIKNPVYLRKKVVLITGASSGIGRATALAFAAMGAYLVIAGRREGDLREVAQQIETLGGEALVVPTDVTNQSEVERLISEALKIWGRIDILVVNAGEYVRCPIAELSMTEVERSMAVNFYGAVSVVLAALPHMRAQGDGHIVLVSSMDGKKGLPFEAPYVAAKSALTGFGDVLRQELHGTGIVVSLVLPGRVDTPMIRDLRVPWISAKIPAEKVASAILRTIRRRSSVVILPFQVRLFYYLSALFPRLGDWIVRFFHLQGWTTTD